MLKRITNLFTRKPRLDHADAAVRLAAVQALDDDQYALGRVFREDEAQEVRLAALARLNDATAIAAGLDDPAMQADAARRLLALPGDLPADVHAHEAVARIELSEAQDEARAAAAAARIVDPEQRVAALLKNPSTRIRASVVDGVWDVELLALVERASRGRDKGLYRMARERIAEQRKAQAQREAEQSEVQRLCAAAEQVADDDPHYDAKRDAIEREWHQLLQTVKSTDASLARFGVAVRDLESLQAALPERREPPVVEESAPAPPPEPEPLEDAEAAPAPTLAERVQAIVERADQLVVDGAVTTDSVASLQAELDALRPATEAAETPAAATGDEAENAVAQADTVRDATLRVEALQRALELEPKAVEIAASSTQPPAGTTPVVAGDGPPSPDAGEDKPPPHEVAFAQAEDASWQELADRLGAARELRREARGLQRRYDWPKNMPRPAPLDGLAAVLTQADSAIETAQQRLQGLADEIADILAKFEAAIGEGSVRAASDHERAARDLIPFLPKDRARSLQAQLGGLSARLRELRDWRTFAESPKREGLCERMEELADSPLAPQPQADEVKSLRAQWNELGRVASRRDRELLQRFDDAAERAFEPCRAHFAELAERRAFNLDQRRAIVEALESYVAGEQWQNSDWTGVERVLRTARSEWRGYYPVDRRAGREVEARFNELTEIIHDHLKSEWDANSARLESIVAEAAAARASEAPLPERIELLKSLQQQWKEAGPVPRRVSQRLWHQFRDECDPVFAEREAAREDRAQQFRKSTGDAEALIDELRALLDSTSPLDESEVADLRARAAAAGHLPRRLMHRLDEAIADVEHALSAQRAAGERESELAWLARVEEVDRAFAEAAASDELEVWRDAAGEYASLFVARFEDDEDDDDEDPHQLTIVSEIEAETPSPEADQNLRLALSIERLNGDLSGERDGPLDHRSLALRWCAAPATAEDALRSRFFGALRTLVVGHRGS